MISMGLGVGLQERIEFLLRRLGISDWNRENAKWHNPVLSFLATS